MNRLPLKHGLELAPVVDVVFLLLAAFLITASVGRVSFLELQLPQSASGQSGAGAAVTVRIDHEGSITLAGRRLTDESLLSEARAVAAQPDKMSVRVAADRRAPYGRVFFVLDTLRTGGLSNVELVAEER